MGDKGQNINVEEIMKEVQEDIKRRNITEKIPDFADIDAAPVIDDSEFFNLDDIEDIAECCSAMNDFKSIEYFEIYQGNKLSVAVKKTIRKIVKFLLYPMVEKQNKFNALVIKAFELNDSGAGMDKTQIEQYFMNQERIIEKLESQVMLLQDKVTELEQQLGER